MFYFVLMAVRPFQKLYLHAAGYIASMLLASSYFTNISYTHSVQIYLLHTVETLE